MSISDLQFREALNKASVEVLKEGKVPSLSRIGQKIKERLPEGSVKPTLTVRLQGYREQWNLDGMNKMLEEIDFDTNVMYKALLSMSSRILSRLNFVETSSRAQNAQMDRIEGLANNLLFVVQDGDGHFDAVYDDFHDLSKVDLTLSTRDIVDLKSQTVELPDASPNTKKINLEHMHTQFAWSVSVNSDSQVIRAETPQDAQFKNIFLDTISMWRYDVITSEAGPTSISFRIPVHRIRGAELSISRVQLIGASEFSQQAEIKYSVDGVNYLKFPGSTSLVELEKSTRTVNIDFALTRVEFIEITLYRSSFDKIVDTGYLTSFGLRHLALYTIGRSYNAELVSKEFSVSDPEKLQKLSLSVYEEIPAGTDIKYYLAAIQREDLDDDEPEKHGQWVPVTPITRAQKKDEAPRVLTLSTLSKNTLTFTPKTPLDELYSYKGVSYYMVNGANDVQAERLITEDVIFRSATLLRGKNAWMRKKSGTEARFKVNNNFISFSTGGRQKVYTTSTETLPFASNLRWDDQERTTIQVTRPIDYRPQDGMSPTAPEGLDPYSIPDPLHSIYEITLISDTEEQTETITFPASEGGKVKFVSAPIDIQEQQETLEYLSAYRPNLGTHDDSLIEALEGRPGLASWHGKTIKNMVSVSTPDDVAAGKPQLTRFTYGNHDGAATTKDRTVDGEVITTVPTPAASQRTLSGLTDEQLLALFGRVTFRTTHIHGITATDTSDPTITYNIGEHFDLFVLPDPTTGIRSLYVARTPADPSRAQSIAANQSVNFHFKYKKDLTPHVLAIQGNRIYLDNKFTSFNNENQGFRVKVAYRFVPIGTNEVIRNTLVVTNIADDLQYIQGKDYHFNPVNGTISLIPSGRIKSEDGKTAVYASFTHKGALNALETFSTWAFISSKDPVKIHYSSLEVDSEFGEKILISTGGGSYADITNTTETPELNYGWHQVLVYSRDPDVHSGTAIKKVTELVDLNGQPVFLAGGDYFSNIQGTRVPMTQVPIDFLKNSVLPNDHSKFAIDSNGRVVVNFQPNTQKDFYTYGYKTVGTGLSPTDTAGFYNETIVLDYNYRREGILAIDGVAFKAVLTRAKDASESITPKLGGYQIRIG